MRCFFVPIALGVLAVPALSQPVAPPVPKPQTVQAMANRVLVETSKIRGLSVLRSVPTRVFSKAQVRSFMASEVKHESAGNQFVAQGLYMRQLGLAPKNFDLQTSYAGLLGEQVAGFYDPRTRAFTTSQSVAPGQLETVMAHELTHALQDQHFDLTRLKKSVGHDSDAQLALTGLIEGDATLVMSRYMTASPLRVFGMVVSSLGGLAGGDTAQLNQSPRVLRETLLFPYLSGLSFVTRLQARDGWPGVSRAFSRPPKSTQQLLHFDLYARDKVPERVAVPDVSRVLGRGWKLLDHDVNGEFGLSLVAGQYGDDAGAKSAATGWAGDHYAVFSGPKGADLVVQDSLWNDAASAATWRAAYEKRTRSRFSANTHESRAGALTTWKVGSEGVWLQQKGRRVVMIEGTVGSFNSSRVLAALGF